MAIADQYFDKVVLACSFDKGLLDEALTQKTITANGNASVSATQKKFGGMSCYFDGAGDYLSVANNGNFNFGAGDFTVEGFFRAESFASIRTFVSVWGDGATTNRQFTIRVNTNSISVYISTNGTTGISAVNATPTISAGVWYHIALVRSGSNIMLFLDGVQVGTTYSIGATALYSPSNPMYIGADPDVGGTIYAPHFGYIDDIRITEGIGRYTANFTPPASALPFYKAQIQGTVKDANGNFARRIVRAHRKSDGLAVHETLSNPSTGEFTLNCPDDSKHYAVVHDSDAWITYLPFNGDNNSTIFPEWGGKQVTPYGNAKISTTESKFGGSSLSLDGVGDYLALQRGPDFDFGSGDFTVEFWVRFNAVPSTGAYVALISKQNAPGVEQSFTLWYGGTEKWFFNFSSSGVATNGGSTVLNTTVPTTGVWYHIAFVRRGGDVDLYIGGVKGTTFSIGTSYMYYGAAPLLIGAANASSPNYYLNGYIDDLIITKGVARHIVNFTPPNAAFYEQLQTFGQQNAMIFDHLTPV